MVLLGNTGGIERVLGWVDGRPVALLVRRVQGLPVALPAAAAFDAMADAAARAGAPLRLVSGFRTRAEQAALYRCYRAGTYPALVLPPGYSQHQSGRALDLETSDPRVFAWLTSHAAAFGFRRTIASEPWHWEFWPAD